MTNQSTKTGLWAFLSRRRFNITDFITYFYLIAGVVVMFGPVLWLIMSSFKDESLIRSGDTTFLPYRKVTTQILSPEIIDHDKTFYGIQLGNANITVYEIAADNGVVYGIDTVLLDDNLSAELGRLAAATEGQFSDDFEFSEELTDGADGTLLASVVDTGNLSTVGKLLITANLESILTSETRTFFAPTDRAFDAITRRYGTHILIALVQEENQPLLNRIIERHVFDGAYTVQDLFAQNGNNIHSLAGNNVKINFSVRDMVVYEVSISNLFVNGSKLAVTNLQASNGYVHGVDQVILTPDLEAAIRALPAVDDVQTPEAIPAIELESRDNLVNTTLGHRDLTVFGQILTTAGNQEVLTGSERYTLLAPTNAAISNFVATYGTALFAEENAALLDEVIALHMTEGGLQIARFFRSYFNEGLPLPMLSGDELLVDYVRGSEIRQLVQVGAPDRSDYAFIDPNTPENGIEIITTFNEAPDVLNIRLEEQTELHFSFSNYTDGLKAFDFWIYFTNSTIVTLTATIFTLLINSMAAFGLSKYKFAGRDAIFLIIISTLMVPVSVILIPAFLVITKVGWNNSLWGLIIPGAATPTGVFLLRQYMLTIPDELIDAARIDGASEWRIYWQVILPLARPALAVLAIFSVMWRWNDFLWPPDCGEPQR